MLESLFVPSEDRINELISTFDSKFAFVETLKTTITSLIDMLNNTEDVPKLVINIGATKYTQKQDMTILDLSFYAPYKEYGDLVLTGFIYIFFMWRLFISLPNVIFGFGGIVQSDFMISDINAFNRFGFGRSSSLNLYQDKKNGGIYRK